MTEIKLLANEESDWNNYVKSKNSSFFHTIEWKKVIEKTFGYKPYYLIAYDNNIMKGILPLFQIKSPLANKILSLPFSFAAGPLYENNEVLEQLINYSQKLFSKNNLDLFEMRMTEKISSTIATKNDLQERNENYVSILDISKGSEHVWNKMDRKHRNAVRKAEKDRVKIIEVESKDQLKHYYDLKLNLSSKKHRIPTEPLKYYYNLWDILKPKNMIKIFFAKYQNKIIGGLILFLYKNEVLYVSGATDDSYSQHQPTNALVWKAIEWASENNFTRFNFGVSSVDNEGLLRFKQKWGTIDHKVPTYYYGITKIDEGHSLFKKIWTKIPASLSKYLGNFLVRWKGG